MKFSAKPRLRVVIADEHPSIRENLRYLLDAEADLEVVGVAKDGVSALQMAMGLRPDVLVIDYELPDYDGLSVARAVRGAGHGTRVILYTMTSEVVAYAKRPEIDACVSKAAAPRVLLEAIRGQRTPAQTKHPRVLVVEDDAEIRSVMRLMLEDDGFEIIETGDGFEALAECERQAPGVVVLDLGLPNMSGQEFATAYRQLRTGKAPIIVVSARNEGRQVAKDLGAAAFLPKPFSLEELSQAVRHAAPVQPSPTSLGL
jgi:CheY-like chemotaxis protein